MGATGEDVQLSPAARKLLPYNIESKAKAQSAVHGWYKQAQAHGDFEPLVVIKLDRDIPLACVSLDHFLDLLEELNVHRSKNNK